MRSSTEKVARITPSHSRIIIRIEASGKDLPRSLLAKTPMHSLLRLSTHAKNKCFVPTAFRKHKRQTPLFPLRLSTHAFFLFGRSTILGAVFFSRLSSRFLWSYCLQFAAIHSSKFTFCFFLRRIKTEMREWAFSLDYSHNHINNS